MMSISKMGAGTEGYYLRLAREDYYARGSEPPGRWAGAGAVDLGFVGVVEPDDLRSLVEGVHPGTGKPLVQSAGSKRHQSGWDLTFSAPKSVSVLWGLGDEATRLRVEEGHQRAVDAALRYVEEEAVIGRRGKGGRSWEQAKAIFAVFDHGTSRAQDPALHSHALLLNIALRDDGTTGTIHSKPCYEHKMAAGAVYRAELASWLEQEMGIRTEPDGASFRIAAIPQPVCEHFSQRRQQIKSALEAEGLQGAWASERAALATRGHKKVLPRSDLYEQWRQEGKAIGYAPEPVVPVVSPVRRIPEVSSLEEGRREARRLIDSTLERDDTFRKTDVIRDLCAGEYGAPRQPPAARHTLPRRDPE